MGRIIIANLTRSLIINAVAAAASFGILYLAYALNVETWPEYISMYLLLFIAAVISVVLVVALFIASKVLHWRFIFGIEVINGKSYWKSRIKSNKPLKAWKANLVFLINFLLCAVAVVVFVFTRETLAEKLISTPATDKAAVIKLLVALAALASTAFVQLLYCICMRSHYKNVKCRGCKNIFCKIDVGIEHQSADYEYKFKDDAVSPSHYYYDKNGRMGFTGGKSASSRTIIRKSFTINTKCVICGNESYRFDNKTIRGSWEEGERY